MQELPVSDDMEVMIRQTDDEYAYNEVNQVAVRAITFGGPDIPLNERPTIDCIVITDED